jgi:hypothetical protein
MTALIFDTLKLSKSLRSDFTPEQADALASALATQRSPSISSRQLDSSWGSLNSSPNSSDPTMSDRHVARHAIIELTPRLIAR